MASESTEQKWELVAFAMDTEPFEAGWEAFAIGNVENDQGELELKVYWRRAVHP